LAVSFPLLNAKIEGPEPEIPAPKAPACRTPLLTLSNSGIKLND